jgi:hypothetical protein
MAFTRAKASSILASNINSGVYIGLSTTTPTVTGGNFSEPSFAAGYERSQFGTVDSSKQAQVANGAIIFFNETLGEGWGTITHFGLFSNKSDTTPFFVGELTSPLTIGAGYVPIFRAHQLVIGLDRGALESYD